MWSTESVAAINSLNDAHPMNALPPGTLLQLMYVKERLRHIKPGCFVEIGPGAGDLSNLLLELGWQGTAFDLEAATIKKLQSRFSTEIAQGRYRPVLGDWLQTGSDMTADLVVSCMVIEHLDDEGEQAFVERARSTLMSGGHMITLVPASPAHWGIEDEIAGHFRRYTADSAQSLLAKAGWTIDHIAGLTFPVSNLLFPVSNWLVRRSEANKLTLSMTERTKQSGNRDVPMKTHFPNLLGLVLNPVVLYPMHLLQKLFSRSDRAMVLYVEAHPDSAR